MALPPASYPGELNGLSPASDSTTRSREMKGPYPSALAEELQLQAPPPIQIEYLDWKRAQLVTLCSQSNYGANSDMESVTSVYEYFWNYESNRGKDCISV